MDALRKLNQAIWLGWFIFERFHLTFEVIQFDIDNILQSELVHWPKLYIRVYTAIHSCGISYHILYPIPFIIYRTCIWLRYIHSAWRRIPKSFVPLSLNDQIVSVVRENVWHQSVPGSFAAGIVHRISVIKLSFASNESCRCVNVEHKDGIIPSF